MAGDGHGAVGGPALTRRNSMRKLAVLLVAVVALTACGESEVDLVSSVQQAASSTFDARSARVSFTTETMGQEMTLDGVFDFADKVAEVSGDGTSFGMGGETTFLYDFSDSLLMYMSLPPEAQAELGGSWLELDLAEAMVQAGIDVDLAAVIQAQSSDPTSALQFLEGAETVTEVGQEELRGTETTHYEVVVNLQKTVDAADPAVRDDMQTLVDLYTVETIPMEVWIDDDGRVRKFVQTIDYDTFELPGDIDLGPLAGTTSTVSAEYYEFGTPVDVSFPDPADTVTMADLMPGGN